MKKMGILTIAAVFMLAACTMVPQAKELVADGLSSSSVAAEAGSVMDLLYYAEDELSFGDAGKSGSNMVRDLSGSGSGYDVLKAYVDLLCDSYDFELTVEPYYQSISSTFFDFVLTYTGSETMIGGGVTGTFSNATGDIMIYGTIERDKLKGAIWYDPALTMADYGYRYGSSSSGKSLIGDSVTAGLYRLDDGSYQTSDGRLSAAVGEAMMVTDGSATTCSATFVMDTDSGHQEISIANGYGVVLQKFYFPATRTLQTGTVYTESEFIVEADYETNTGGIHDSMPSYTWSTMFACAHNDSYIVPVRGMSGEMTALNVRVMYVEQESVAVFYTCAQFQTAPYEIEALIAVSIGTDTVVANQADEEYTISTGESVSITGPWEFDSGYNLWTWEFLEGSNLAEMSGTVSQTCTVTGHKTGDVRVKVTYEYSVEEADVLTGIERSVGKSTTREYVIHIVN
ncbi:MAG: hypothetical protein LUF35_08995 [Lachnospiraceae bacterium]|nr:hypothetical protein [Lachnospiraceae bacterium]